MHTDKQTGFTLIELVVVVAIVAIIAAIAVPSYLSQVRKSHRSEAVQTLSDLQLRQERYRADHASYTNTLADLNFNSTGLSYYSVAASTPSNVSGCTCGSSPSATCYAFTATATGDQAADSCATFVLSNRCGTVQKTSTPSGTRCW